MLQSFNVLRYELGQKYDSHYDAFNPAEYGPQQSQRVNIFFMVLFIYLLLSGSRITACLIERTMASFNVVIHCSTLGS